jgi:hypothetical protein
MVRFKVNAKSHVIDSNICTHALQLLDFYEKSATTLDNLEKHYLRIKIDKLLVITEEKFYPESRTYQILCYLRNRLLIQTKINY